MSWPDDWVIDIRIRWRKTSWRFVGRCQLARSFVYQSEWSSGLRRCSIFALHLSCQLVLLALLWLIYRPSWLHICFSVWLPVRVSRYSWLQTVGVCMKGIIGVIAYICIGFRSRPISYSVRRWCTLHSKCGSNSTFVEAFRTYVAALEFRLLLDGVRDIKWLRGAHPIPRPGWPHRLSTFKLGFID